MRQGGRTGLTAALCGMSALTLALSHRMGEGIGLTPALSRRLIIADKSGLPLKAIPKGLCPPAQGCEPASYPGICCRIPSGFARILTRDVGNDEPAGAGEPGTRALVSCTLSRESMNSRSIVK